MTQTTCISANITKTNGAMTIAAAGNIPSTDTTKQDFSLEEMNRPVRIGYGSKVFEAVSATSSGNVGTMKALSGSVFSYQEKDKYIIPQVSAYVGGVASTLLRSPSSKVPNRSNNKIVAVHTGYLTGIAFTFGQDGIPLFTPTTTASNPDFGVDHDNLAPVTAAEFAYRDGSPSVIQDDYILPYSN